MTGAACVHRVGTSADLSYPRLLAGHPRNRGVDWVEVGRYAEHGSPSDTSRFDIFVKTDREIDAIWIPGRTGFLLSDRLRKVLEPVAGGPVEFLPIAVNSRPFWILRVNHVVDALDMERSQIRYLRGGSIAAIEIPVWRGDRITDPSLFRIPQQPFDIWATPAVARAYETSGCNGLGFGPRGHVI